MLVLSSEQTDAFHLTLANLSDSDRLRLGELMPEATVKVVEAAPHWDFELCAKAVDELIGTTPDDPATAALRRGFIAMWCLELPRRVAAYRLPRDVLDNYPHWLGRTAQYLSEEKPFYDRDHWAKDVRFATAMSVPGSRTHLIDLSSPVGPRQTIEHVLGGHGYSAPFRWLAAGGWGQWVEAHTESRDLSDFNPAGWDRTWMAAAGIVEAYSGLRGAIGSSWFYDPPLKTISPRLAYLREMPLKNGAFLVHQGPGEIHSERAAASSPTRRAMIENGTYVPRSWLVVWPRRALLKWAASERRRQSTLEQIIDQAEETGRIASPA
ncbi:hypothetical protein [uncultured Brevundimonas sp.]|uniref:hypothetical protein n=1 Tax=uncultured Brevundimonas sp. TaxID=213418 RepID=UPI00263459BB|nr:hypothetical protein [uncultured Brevundimonas sp.]